MSGFRARSRAGCLFIDDAVFNRQEDGSLKSLTPRQVADLLGHATSEITELYYVKKDTARLNGITNGFEL